jgi:hypothetical protein
LIVVLVSCETCPSDGNNWNVNVNV